MRPSEASGIRSKGAVVLGAFFLAAAGCGDGAISAMLAMDDGGAAGAAGDPSGNGGSGGGGGTVGPGGQGGKPAGGGAGGGTGTAGQGGQGSNVVGPPPGSRAPREGFGAQTRGGEGGRVIHVTEATDKAVRDAFTAANAGNAIIVFDVKGTVAPTSRLPSLSGASITVQGNGITIDGAKAGTYNIEVTGHDIILQDIRTRNGYDNVSVKEPAYNVVLDHISTTGSADDGMSIGYGAHDVTVQYSFFAGNTRSIFISYQGDKNKLDKISLHHNWVMKQFMRGPKASEAMVDIRNMIVEDWKLWGTRFESGGSGNAINSLWVMSAYAKSIGGREVNSLYLDGAGPVWFEGNVFRGEAKESEAGKPSAPGPLPAPPVTTLSVAQMEPIVRAQAGCLPRDAVDQKYIDTNTGWDVSGTTPYRPRL